MNNQPTSESFIGIDQGSSSTKAVVLSIQGAVIAEHSWPIRTIVTKDGTVELVEHEPEEVIDSVRSAVSWGTAASREAGFEARGVGFAVQRSGVVAWQAAGHSVSRVLSWRDGRTREGCGRLRANPAIEAMIEGRSGLVPNSFFAGSKIGVMQRAFSDPSYRVATLDSYILARLCRDAPFITDDSMAARTLLYDLEARGWSEELCSVWDVMEKRLPRIVPSVGHRGFLAQGIPVLASLGDKEAAAAYLLSEGERSPRTGRAVLDLGTLATLTVACESLPRASVGIARGVLCSVNGPHRERLITYEQEVRTSITGDVLEWLASRFGKRFSFEDLSQLWAVGSGHEGVMYCAARTGSFGDAAGERAKMRCERVGESVSCLVRAALEHIIFSLAEVIEAARSADMIGARGELVVSGGLAHIDGLCQMLADVVQLSLVVRSPQASASALGAARLAMGGARGVTARGALSQGTDEGERRCEPAPGGLTGAVAERSARWRALRESVLGRS